MRVAEIIILAWIAFWLVVLVGFIYLVISLVKRNRTVVYVPTIFPKEHDDNSKPEKEKPKTSIDQNQKIALPQQQEIRYVTISDIVRCEASDNYTFFIMRDNEKILISRSLKEFSNALKPYGFMRSHQSHLVNPLYVKSWLKEDGGALLLFNGDKVPVSKPNREAVKETLES